MGKKPGMLDDEHYDDKYIAIEDETGTRIYRVERFIADLKNLIAGYMDIDPDGVGLNNLYSDYGMDMDDVIELGDECVEELLPDYAGITEDEIRGWASVYDTAASLIRAVEGGIQHLRVDSGIRPYRGKKKGGRK